MQAFIINVVSIIADMVWLLVLSNIWTKSAAVGEDNWDSYRGIRGLTLVLSAAGMLLKVIN